MKRVRANVIMAGYAFKKRERTPGDENESTCVVYLENICWGGVFQGLLMDNIIPNKLMTKTDDILAHVEEIGSGFGPIVTDDAGGIEFTVMGVNPNITGNLRAVSGGEVGLGSDNVISKHERYKNREMNELRNPLHTDTEGGGIGVAEVQNFKGKSLPPHVERSASGGFNTTKSQGTKGGRGFSKRNPVVTSNRPKPSRSGSGESVKIGGQPSEKEEVVVTTEGGERKKPPSRWETVFDPTYNRDYYHDKNTDVTTWEKPDDL